MIVIYIYFDSLDVVDAKNYKYSSRQKRYNVEIK